MPDTRKSTTASEEDMVLPAAACASDAVSAVSPPHKLKGYLQVKHNPHAAAGKSRARLLRKVKPPKFHFHLFFARAFVHSSSFFFFGRRVFGGRRSSI